MAIVYKADLTPSKLELIASWLPSQQWYAGGSAATPRALELIGAFRFDDPAGEVGIQTYLVRPNADAPIYQVPMTYRGAPLGGADDALIGETNHSVLGRRYVYDGCHDPVFVGELVRAVLTGGTEVIESLHTDGAEPVALPAGMRVRGSGHPTTSTFQPGPLNVTPVGGTGSPTVIRTGNVEVSVLRVLGQEPAIGGAAELTGEWGESERQCLATVRVADAGSASPS